MKVANIFSIPNQKHYKNEQMVMILAHLLKDKMYSKKYFSSKQYIILDNGAFEGSMVSENLQDIIDLAEQSDIPIDEIVVPDVFLDLEGTVNIFMNSIDIIKKYKKKYRFMIVAASKSINELQKIVDIINLKGLEHGLDLTIGIPKLVPYNRSGAEALSIYLKCTYPIHFLGIKNSLAETLPVANYIRSCDSAQLSHILLGGNRAEKFDGLSIINYQREKTKIDLVNDKVNDEELSDLIKKELSGLGYYGIL